MFKFLKEKLKKSIAHFSKEIEEKGVEEVKELEIKDEDSKQIPESAFAEEKKSEEVEPPKDKKPGFFSRIFKKKQIKEGSPRRHGEHGDARRKKERGAQGAKKKGSGTQLVFSFCAFAPPLLCSFLRASLCSPCLRGELCFLFLFLLSCVSACH